MKPELKQLFGGVEILSPIRILILTIGILFTVGVPLIMIIKGKKDKFISLSILMDKYNLLVTRQKTTKYGII